MYRQPMTSSVPGRCTVNVKPMRSAKSGACPSKSRRLASSDMPSTGGHPPDSKPGVARMCTMLDVHAAWSDSLCSTPSGTRWNSGSSSSRGGSNSSGTKGSALTAREATAGPGEAPPAHLLHVLVALRLWARRASPQGAPPDTDYRPAARYGFHAESGPSGLLLVVSMKEDGLSSMKERALSSPG